LLKSRASPDMLPFSLCNKKRHAIWHMNRPLFPTTLSITSYDIGKLVGLRTYQHPLVCMFTYIYMSMDQKKISYQQFLCFNSIPYSRFHCYILSHFTKYNVFIFNAYYVFTELHLTIQIFPF
jgi:hypothetical protein